MIKNLIALLVYGESNSNRNALTEEKYKDLTNAFMENGFEVSSVLFNDDAVDKLKIDLLKFDAVLVWVNPIEKGKDRKILDSLLKEISEKGIYVSSHPDIILKIGTKEVLYQTKDMDWGGDTMIYRTFEEFKTHFIPILKNSRIRILKQYRGNGGNGVFKVSKPDSNSIAVTHATPGDKEIMSTEEDFFKEFESYFSNNGLLIDQEWNQNITNGMVRCYLTANKVSGFGYQEINALYPSDSPSGYKAPSKRFYFSEYCGLFADLKEVMENKWVPELQDKFSIKTEELPVIWDADFFINDVNAKTVIGKYTLCEINVSSVSPFPPSAIKHIVNAVKERTVSNN